MSTMNFPFQLAVAATKRARAKIARTTPRQALSTTSRVSPCAIPIDEASIHISVLEWLRLVLPGALIWHPANGGSRDVREAIKLKRMGVVAGIPDLIIFMDGAFAFAFEIKTATGRLSVEQQGVHEVMRRLGFKVAAVRGIEDVRAMLAAWEIKTKESHRG